MIARVVQRLVRGMDVTIAHVYLSLFRERNSLITFLFHALFRNEEEMDLNMIDPLERTTVAQFRRLIEYYVKHGYQFVTPQQAIEGLDPEGRFALLTFDDGYYNNLLALPVLEEFRVPALFFISTDHVQQQKCYWWDVFYRQRLAQGADADLAYIEALALKNFRTEEIELKLIERFGADALKPRGDIDRPFRSDELKKFASSPYVFLGNHTTGHAILTNYTPDEVRQQIAGAQTYLTHLTGVTPTTIAYPNGALNRVIAQIAMEEGLKLGFTVRPQKNVLPLDSGDGRLMRLGRFVPHSESAIESQCLTYRSDVLLYGTVRDWYLRFARGQSSEFGT